MNKRIFLRLENGNYTAVGSEAEVSASDVQYAIDAYNKSNNDKLLYYDRATGDVCLTDEVPTFMRGKLKS